MPTTSRALSFDTEHEHATTAVRECRKLIGDGVAVRAGNSVAGEPDFLDFQKRALTEANLVE